jgi:hypothetical protein
MAEQRDREMARRIIDGFDLAVKLSTRDYDQAADLIAARVAEAVKEKDAEIERLRQMLGALACYAESGRIGGHQLTYEEGAALVRKARVAIGLEQALAPQEGEK